MHCRKGPQVRLKLNDPLFHFFSQFLGLKIKKDNLDPKLYKMWVCGLLKGPFHDIFECWFFHQIAPPGPIRGPFGRFRFLPPGCKIIRIVH